MGLTHHQEIRALNSLQFSKKTDPHRNQKQSKNGLTKVINPQEESSQSMCKTCNLMTS